MTSESDQQQHFILFPFMAQGHLIPMIDIARLLAQHGVLITVITTPINANRTRQIVDRAVESGLPIKLIELKIPAEEAGLPQGCENMDMLSSLGLAKEFMSATNQLQKPVETLLEEIQPRPNCIISDMNLPYTSQVAAKFQIPRISFNGFSCFCMLCMERVHKSGLLERVKSESEYFSVPGLPPHIQFTKQQLPWATLRNFGSLTGKIYAAEEASYGIIMNSFEELELEYLTEYQNGRQDFKVWCVGPVSLNNTHSLDLIQRGGTLSIQESSRCLKWLDEQEPGSVLYVSFGSLCNLVTLQLIELALGLEASNRPFIWVIRGGEKSREIEKWIEEEGFEKRTRARSLIIRGWAPQLAVLWHTATGGFLTHCGWNSTLEAISAGLPMITWPLFGDQFCNEKLVVEVLEIGVKVGAKEVLTWGEEDKFEVSIRKEDVTMAVMKLMGEGEEEEGRRRRAKELSLNAKTAVEPNGSSCLNIERFIEEIRMLTSTKPDSGLSLGGESVLE